MFSPLKINGLRWICSQVLDLQADLEPHNYTMCNWNWNSSVVLSNLSNVVEIWLLTDDRGRSKGFRLTYQMTLLKDEGKPA